MGRIIRFGVSAEAELLDRFDRLIKKKKYKNRSEAIRDLMREKLVQKQWEEDEDIAGTITIIYEHHKRGLLNELTSIQHGYAELIISTQHIHLNEDKCIEVLIVRGKASEVKNLFHQLNSLKGVKHGDLTMTTIGKEI
ncbi:MAG: nickel-responsive transcriptional regulator NikR [Nitrospirae bacterium]|nr:MAG: nickel-responsive transcriptional regulator NikR [Nitrospirota bacterium]